MALYRGAGRGPHRLALPTGEMVYHTMNRRHGADRLDFPLNPFRQGRRPSLCEVLSTVLSRLNDDRSNAEESREHDDRGCGCPTE